MNNVQIFEKEEFGQVRIVDNNGEPWFVLTDILRAMETTTPTSVARQNIEDVFGAGLIAITQLDTGYGVKDTIIVSEPAMTFIVSQGRTETSKKLNRWIHAEVLPAIRKTGSYTSPNANLEKVPHVQYDFRIAEEVASFLRFSDTSRLKIARKILTKHSCDLTLLPEYAENTQPCLSATDLLKKHGAGIKTAAFNKLMLASGFLEEHHRKSRKTGEMKPFKSLTKEGLEYGQNDTSDQNPNETQPRYFVNKFDDLLKALGLKE